LTGKRPNLSELYYCQQLAKRMSFIFVKYIGISFTASPNVLDK